MPGATGGENSGVIVSSTTGNSSYGGAGGGGGGTGRIRVNAHGSCGLDAAAVFSPARSTNGASGCP